MDDLHLAKMVANLVTEEISKGNIATLTKSTGLSKHWFYEISKGGIVDPRSSAIIKFLKAIDHPLIKEINKHTHCSFKKAC